MEKWSHVLKIFLIPETARDNCALITFIKVMHGTIVDGQLTMRLQHDLNPQNALSLEAIVTSVLKIPF